MICSLRQYNIADENNQFSLELTKEREFLMNFLRIHEKDEYLMYNKKVRIFRKQVRKSHGIYRTLS